MARKRYSDEDVVPAFSIRAMVMREQPTIGATSRHLRIFIDVNSTMTRIPFNLTGARQRSTPLSWKAK